MSWYTDCDINRLVKDAQITYYQVMFVCSNYFTHMILNRSVGKGGTRRGAVAPQSFEKPFFINVEIRLENCWEGGLSHGERRPFTKSRPRLRP